MIDTVKSLNKNTIKPVLRFIGSWDSNIYSLNTQGASFYHFTLDSYNGKNSFTGGFAWSLSGCYSYDNTPYDQYAIDLKTLDVYNLNDKTIIFNAKDIL